jgi:hypothetical protein
VILRDRLGGERLPLVGLRRGHDDPLAEDLAATGGVEEMCSGNGESSRMGRRLGELEHHSRAREAEHDPARSLHAWHAEHLGGTAIGMPRRDCIDDVVVAFLGGHRLESVFHEREPVVTGHAGKYDGRDGRSSTRGDRQP